MSALQSLIWTLAVTVDGTVELNKLTKALGNSDTAKVIY